MLPGAEPRRRAQHRGGGIVSERFRRARSLIAQRAVDDYRDPSQSAVGQRLNDRSRRPPGEQRPSGPKKYAERQAREDPGAHGRGESSGRNGLSKPRCGA